MKYFTCYRKWAKFKLFQNISIRTGKEIQCATSESILKIKTKQNILIILVSRSNIKKKCFSISIFFASYFKILSNVYIYLNNRPF